MNLQELRDAARRQLDMDAEELPDATLDLFIQDGYNRIVQMEPQWPFFQNTWSLATIEGQVGYDKEATIAAVTSLFDVSARAQLSHVDHNFAEQLYGDGSFDFGTPTMWSEWGNAIYLWPTPNVVKTIQIRGYRLPQDWIAKGATTQVDADNRLHLPILFYTVSLCYAQQEDEVLEGTYMQRFEQTAGRAHNDVMRTPTRRPIVLSGGSVYPTYPNLTWDFS